jgi:serine/threonine protein kinase
VRGETVESIAGDQGPLSDREAVVIGEGVCRALAAVHSVKLIHRDVKAQNIIRERAGRIVLMDFGAVVWEGSDSDNAPAMGTPLYIRGADNRGAPAGPRRMAIDRAAQGWLEVPRS